MPDVFVTRHITDYLLKIYRPKHPLYEKLQPTPPLYANGILFLLAIFISARAFRDFPTIRDVLSVRPPPREKFRIMDWSDDVLDDPVFPEMRPSGPTKKAKNKDAWGHQCSDWEKRAGFAGGMGLHAARREELIKVDGKILVLVKLMLWETNRPQTAVILLVK
jgi:hypothetical protein